MPEKTSFTSADGTVITAEVVGDGPGLVVLPGTLQSARSMRRLAEHLADSHTVFVLDRRGRGDSGPQGDDYSFDREAEDVIALLRREGASALFGHSSGGLVALETALRHPVRKLAVYEPPVSVADPTADPWYPDFEQALAAGRNALALSIMLKGLEGLGSASRMPLPFVRFMVSALTWTEEGREMVALVPTFPAEYREVERLAYSPVRYRGIGADTLVLAGSRGAQEYRAGGEFLASVIPRSRYLELRGLGHGGPDQQAPGQVAEVLREFIARAPGAEARG